MVARRQLQFFLSGFVLIAGCMQGEGARHFETGQVETIWSGDQLNVTVHQKLKLSSEAKEALVHGVPLTLQLELLIRTTGAQTAINRNIYNYEIRYLPLISHYQLTRPHTAEIRTFPRLRHLLAELSTISQSFPQGELPEEKVELMVRTRLDHSKMPPPMRLPILFSAQWRHDSDWSSWPMGRENGG
jgi:hypothetical protein